MRRLGLLGLLLALLGFAPAAQAQTTITASPTSVVANGTVTASWAGLVAPINADDWLGYFTPGAPNSSPTAWLRLDCTQVSGATPASGSCSFSMPVAGGTYEFRIVDAGSAATLATFGPVTVAAATPTTTPTATPTPGPGTPTATPVQPTATPAQSTSLFYSQVLGAPQQTIRIQLPALPVRILIVGRSTINANAVSLGLQFNDDTSRNYTWNNQVANGAGGTAATLVEQAAASNSDDEVRIRVGWLPGATTPSGAWGSYSIDVLAPNQAIFFGGASLGFGPTMGFEGYGSRYAADRASSPGATTSVTLMQDTGDSFAAGTTVRAVTL